MLKTLFSPRVLWGAVLTSSLVVGTSLARNAAAVPFVLSDKNSTVVIDPSEVLEEAHFRSWEVDGTEHLYEETWFYRVGSSGAESDVGTLTLVSATASDLDADAGDETLDLSYSLAGVFDIDISYVLEGGISVTSLVSETVTVTDTRTVGGVQTLNLFEYSDFDLHLTEIHKSVSAARAGCPSANVVAVQPFDIP